MFEYKILNTAQDIARETMPRLDEGPIGLSGGSTYKEIFSSEIRKCHNLGLIIFLF